MGRHKDSNGTRKRKYDLHFTKIKDKTSKGKTIKNIDRRYFYGEDSQNRK